MHVHFGVRVFKSSTFTASAGEKVYKVNTIAEKIDVCFTLPKRPGF